MNKITLDEKERDILEIICNWYLFNNWRLQQNLEPHAPPLSPSGIQRLRELYDNKLVIQL